MTYDKWKTDPDDIKDDFTPDEIKEDDEREELYAELDKLRAINTDLLDAAIAIVALVEHRMLLPNGAVMTQLKAAIAKAEALS